MKRKTVILCAAVLAIVLCFCAACNKNKKGGGDSAGTVNGIKLTRPIFGYAFNFTAEDIYLEGNVPFDKFGTEEFVTVLKETDNADGKNYFDVIIDDTLEYAHKYLVNESLAREKDSWPSDADLKKRGEELKTELESSYAYYIQYYGYTLDMIALQRFGMPLSDYMEIFPRTEAVEKYNIDWESGMTPSEEELEQFYKADESSYKIITVRHSLLLTQEMSAEEKAEVLKKAQGYVEAVKNGTMTFDEVVALSEDNGLETNDGYYDVVKNSGFVKPFEEWAIAQTEVTEIPEIVETEYGYHLMVCTGIKGYDNEDVRKNVDAGWRAKQIENELDALKTQEKYALKKTDRAQAEKFAVMFCTMTFDDAEEPEPTEVVTATPKPVYNDAPLNDSVVATVGDHKVLYPELVYLFGTSVNDVVGEDITFEDDLTEAQRFEYLKSFLEGKYKDTDMTYLDKIKERTLEQLLQFRAAYSMALGSKEPFTEEKIQQMNDEIDQYVDYYLTYAGENYGVTTRDEYMKYVTGMNVNDYKYFNEMQTFLSEFAEEQMAAMEVPEETIKNYYTEHEDVYRTIGIRHIYLPFTDEDSDGTISDAEKQTVKDQAAVLVNKMVVDGDSPEAIVRAYSAAEDATLSGGIINRSSASSTFTDEINAWIASAESIGLDTLRTFETEDGVEIMYVVGILTFDGLTGETGSTEITLEKLKTAVETAYKNEEYERRIKQYISDNSLELKDVSNELIEQAVTEYLTFESEEPEEEEE